MTQYEIVGEFKKMDINISQKTISNDIAWHRKDAVDYIKRNREQIALEYKLIMSNFHQLRREAWKHFRSTGNDTVKSNLYGIIESINDNILNLLSVGDLIEIEMLQKAKQESDARREDLNQTFEQLKNTQALV